MGKEAWLHQRMTTTRGRSQQALVNIAQDFPGSGDPRSQSSASCLKWELQANLMLVKRIQKAETVVVRSSIVLLGKGMEMGHSLSHQGWGGVGGGPDLCLSGGLFVSWSQLAQW